MRFEENAAATAVEREHDAEYPHVIVIDDEDDEDLAVA